ncbi:hypothetical protein M8332_01925 [Fructilactobacillus ixorae]|uniref:Transposase n=1 Tax=Fructilactobacillus ixorae TaxID=1750535 RepID=A0ABY5C7P9_9LACO|nr:hypothetical protein [Fructilactobacillus ixorae]USS93633.1 hypothetical protein M8332_01925 [Fructilactobacillus ixorae]
MNEITIKEILGLTDPNIIVDDTTKSRTIVKEDGVTKNYWRFILTYKLRCKNCGHYLNKNGFKTVQHLAPAGLWGLNFLIIKKQKYICKYCHHKELAKLKDINPNDHILRNLKIKEALQLSSNITIKQITENFGISTNTVMRQA